MREWVVPLISRNENGRPVVHMINRRSKRWRERIRDNDHYTAAAFAVSRRIAAYICEDPDVLRDAETLLRQFEQDYREFHGIDDDNYVDEAEFQYALSYAMSMLGIETVDRPPPPPPPPQDAAAPFRCVSFNQVRAATPDADEKLMCCVCFNDDPVGFAKLPCRHPLCVECYARLRHNGVDACPVCRQRFDYVGIVPEDDT